MKYEDDSYITKRFYDALTQLDRKQEVKESLWRPGNELCPRTGPSSSTAINLSRCLLNVIHLVHLYRTPCNCYPAIVDLDVKHGNGNSHFFKHVILFIWHNIFLCSKKSTSRSVSRIDLSKMMEKKLTLIPSTLAGIITLTIYVLLAEDSPRWQTSFLAYRTRFPHTRCTLLYCV